MRTFALTKQQKRVAIQAFNTAIDSWGKRCFLEYPRTRTECPNCELDITSDASAGIYKVGGTISFPVGTICPVCSGAGYVESASGRTVKMRFYDDPAEWILKAPPGAPDGLIESRCALEYFAAIRACARMTILDEPYRDRAYELFGDPVDPYGELRGQWVVCLWRRIA